VRTAFVGPVDNVESIGDPEIKQHRDEKDRNDKRIEKEIIQKK
jgi:hypothetical protein